MQLKRGRRGWDFQLGRQPAGYAQRHLSIFTAPLGSLPKQHILQPLISFSVLCEYQAISLCHSGPSSSAWSA